MTTRVKQTYAAASIREYHIDNHRNETYVPQAGDAAVFRVLNPSGNYVIGADQVNIHVFAGDLIVAVFGARYATSQYEAYVPATPVRTCQLVGRGGVAGVVVSANPTFRNPPMELELVGYATDRNGRVINTIRRDKLEAFSSTGLRRAKVVLSIGSSMDSGKTTTAANLCAGLTAQGLRAAFVKLTGTAFPKDARYVYDRGACYACDFTRLGYPSTFLMDTPELLNLYQTLLRAVEDRCDPDVVVVEIADGIQQRETLALLSDAAFMRTVHGVVFSCGDSLSAPMGIDLLAKLNIRPMALSGLFTASELLIREAETLCNVPVLRAAQLVDGAGVPELLRLPVRRSVPTPQGVLVAA